MISQKYSRTYHYPFSPGTTSDDRINYNYWSDIQRIEKIVHTEKLDGENNCLSKLGVFARSHVAPSISAWTAQLRERWTLLKNDLENIEIFGENLYAIHSIEYKHIEEYFFVFTIRYLDMWLSWEEIEFYAALFDFPTVPILAIESTSNLSTTSLQQNIENWAKESSCFGSKNASTHLDCVKEGVVTRNTSQYLVSNFKNNVFKYVRKGHVITHVHWAKQWKRAKLI